MPTRTARRCTSRRSWCRCSAPIVFKNLHYDPVKDFAPVTQVLTFRYALAVGPNHPARTAPEFVAWAKTHGKEATFGTAGAGSVPHFFGVMIDQATGTHLVHVPYKGAAPMLADLMGGQIAAGVDSLTNLIELHRAGRIRIVAISGAERSPLSPAVPTFKEQGLAAVDAVGWVAVYARGGNAEAGDRSVVGGDRRDPAKAGDQGAVPQPRRRADRHDAGGARGDHGGRHGALGADRQGLGFYRRLAITRARA